MNLLKLSNFQLQLRALISEINHLKERDRFASEQLQFSVQKENKAEEEANQRLADLQAELVVSNELRYKLEGKVNCLESENALLENRQKELRETINDLLQSRDSFVKAYEDSTCEMKRAIESKDRMILFLTEKIKAHSLLVKSIEKEASSIKQIVDDTHCILNEKEEAVLMLKKKVHEIASFEKLFIERISDLECKMRNNEEVLTRKDKIILGLEAQLKLAKTSDEFQPTIDELQKALSTKELIIQNLKSQKKVLHLEVGSLGFIIKKIQDAVTHMNEKDRETFSSVLEGQEECATIEESKTNELTDGPTDNGEKSVQNASGKEPVDDSGISTHDEFIEGCVSSLTEDIIMQSRVLESSCSPSKIPPRPASNIPSVSHA